VAASLGAAAGLDVDGRATVMAGAGAAILLLGLGLSTRRPAAILVAVLLLSALHVIADGGQSIGTVIYGSGLLLTAELAYWSIDEHGRRPVEPGVFAPRLLAILAVVVVGIPASLVVYLAAGVDISRSAASTAAGATAIVACMALLAALARGRVARTMSPTQQK
jgi:hypothetical protein